MTGTRNTASPADGGSDFSPSAAASIIDQTTDSAQRAFDTSSSIAAVLGAAVFLFGYGAVWWTTRDQQVYSGPPLWAIILLYGLIVVSAIIARQLFHRVARGVGGRMRRQMIAAGVAVAAAGIAAWTVQGALRYLGVGFEIVYGVYGPTVPLIALAAASTGFAAARSKWLELYLAVAIMLIAAGSTFFGPAGAWGLTGLGSATALVVYGIAVKVRQHRTVQS